MIETLTSVISITTKPGEENNNKEVGQQNIHTFA